MSEMAETLDKGKILIIDDEYSIRWSFERALKRHGYDYALAENGLKGLELYQSFKPDLVLVDIRMPEIDGLKVLSEIKRQDPDALVIVMTAYTDMETTISAMKLGAYDFLSKPFNINESLILIARGITALRTAKKAEVGVQAPKSSALKGNSPLMQEVYKLIGKVSGEDITVLITGESGCGKELVAQAIHYNSHRSQKPFWAINCTAISESLMESELFGHEKGAFTGATGSKSGMFELAQGGTIFLDEIGDMNLEMQAKLLRVLEEREIVRVGGNRRIQVDVRIITATNKNLRNLIAQNLFREDLYHRIKVIEIKLPALRERPEDISLLATYFCSLLASERVGTPKSIDDEAMKSLLAYHWPGNVRELRNAIQQSYTLSRGTVILSEHLPAEVQNVVKSKVAVEDKQTANQELTKLEAEEKGTAEGRWFSPLVASVDELTLEDLDEQIVHLIKELNGFAPSNEVFPFILEKIEKEVIKQSLAKHNGNQVQSANNLGITRNTLRAKIDKYDL